MKELVDVASEASPHEILLVVDAMTGQEAVNVAQGFKDQVDLTGIILTKLDGDARGGAAISVREVTGVPIKFVGVGETLEGLEAFHPDRMASRILGMGDVMSLIEKAEETFDQAEAEKTAAKMQKGQFTLEDFLEQFQALKRMGPLKGRPCYASGLRFPAQTGQRRRSRPCQGGGDHPFDDRRRAPEPKDHRRKPQAEDRDRIGHDARPTSTACCHNSPMRKR